MLDANPIPTAPSEKAGERDVNQPPHLDRIVLVDPLLETANVFNDFLQLINYASLGAGDGHWLARAHLLVAFLRKWECTVALSHLLLLLQREAQQLHVSPLRSFAVCAAAHDADACRHILTTSDFGDYNDPTHPGNKYRQCMDDVRG